MRPATSPILRATALALLVFGTACGDSATAPAPGIQPQIINNTDAFSYQLTNLDNVSGTYHYTWQNTGTLAKITHASDAGSTGTATVTLTDANGVEVYSGPFATTGEVVSSPAGMAGAWTITVTYSIYSNTQVNFSVVTQ